MIYYKVTLRVQNEAGVLARITTLLRKYQINIQSLDVAPIDGEEKFSDIHMLIQPPRAQVEIVMQKLQKLIPVISVLYKEHS
ncbi:ACT domain-containing protein [Candidatus Gracilibacteria bacterium]|nr:ACT domain-containing protein [Candidatus Gracilibacteria bacterium]